MGKNKSKLLNILRVPSSSVVRHPVTRRSLVQFLIGTNELNIRFFLFARDMYNENLYLSFSVLLSSLRTEGINCGKNGIQCALSPLSTSAAQSNALEATYEERENYYLLTTINYLFRLGFKSARIQTITESPGILLEAWLGSLCCVFG